MINRFHNHFGKTMFSALLCFLTASESLGQQAADYSVQANIVYRFTKYINWPENMKSGDFVIGVVGDTPLYEELKDFVKNKKAGNQKIVIRKLSPSSSYRCHILFVSDDESGSMKKIVARTTGISTLLVSESERLAEKGGCINFVIVSDHLKLEINKNNIEQRGLSIASELLQLGTIVK